MKKFLLSALVALMTVGLTACGDPEDMENMEENMEQENMEQQEQDMSGQDDGMDSGDGFGEESGMESEE